MTNTPPTGTTPDSVINPNDPATLNDAADAANNAQSAFNAFSTVADQARGVLGTFYDRMRSAQIDLQVNKRLTEDQTAAFGFLTSSLLGARKAFDNLSGIDTSYLSTFKSQWEDLKTAIDQDPTMDAAKKIGVFGKALIGAGADSKIVGTLMTQGLDSVSKFANAFFESADNALRLQNAMIQLAAKTGSLNEVIRVSGPNLSNINMLLALQQKAVSDAAQATGLGTTQVENYYAALGAIPKALQETVSSATQAGGKVSMLTAAIQYAQGSGRNYTEVVEDLRTAFRDYNITGEKALQFTARIGELSNRFGIELSDVRDAVRNTADAFAMFGNEGEAAAKIMNQYIGSLEQTGLSGAKSLEVVKNMTSGIASLGIAQKAFVSGQTGGPGGLMGAFQIDKLMREGKMDEVMNRVKQVLTRQFGQIVTLDEAARSPQAAAQMTRQIMMLRQGPLGSLARDDQSAMRLLEAMRNQGRPGGAAAMLSPTVVQDNMKVGVDLQRKAVTELTAIRETIQRAQGAAGIANLTTAQQAFTAGVGVPETGATGGARAANMRRNLSLGMERGAAGSAVATTDIQASLDTGLIKQKTGTFAATALEEFGSLYDQLGEALKAPVAKIKSLFQAGKGDEAMRAYQEQMRQLDAESKSLDLAPPLAAAAQKEEIKRQKSLLQRAFESAKGAGAQGPAVPGIDLQDLGVNARDLDIQGPAEVGAAAATVARRQATNVAAPEGAAAQPRVPTTIAAPAEMGEITVHVEGYCLDCGEKMKGTTQRLAVAPQTRGR